MSAQCAILSFVLAKRLIAKNNADMLHNISYLFHVFKRLLNLAKNKEHYEAAENIHFLPCCWKIILCQRAKIYESNGH
jgi:hypothetical protein